MPVRGMTEHKLEPLRHAMESGHLVVNAKVDAEEEKLFPRQFVPAGRACHLVNAATGSTGVAAFQSHCGEPAMARLGCSGHNKLPVYLFRDSDSPSVGFGPNNTPDPLTSLGPGWSTGGTGRVLFYLGLEGFELQTTEFDKTREYFVGDYLKADELGDTTAATAADDAENKAGILTNDVTVGTDTIIGIVSPGLATPLGPENADPLNLGAEQKIDAHGNLVLSFFTTYRPS